MLVTIDKRGSISLPASVRKELKLQPGTCLDLSILRGGGLALVPMALFPTVRISPEATVKLQEARESGTGELPQWLQEEITSASPDTL